MIEMQGRIKQQEEFALGLVPPHRIGCKHHHMAFPYRNINYSGFACQFAAACRACRLTTNFSRPMQNAGLHAGAYSVVEPRRRQTWLRVKSRLREKKGARYSLKIAPRRRQYQGRRKRRRCSPEARGTDDATPLVPHDEMEEMRHRWNDVQAAFVDEPRRAVEQADGLVASAMKRLAEVFSEERSKLERQWDRGDNVSTEDLRIALQRYRSFFHRLLSI